MNSRFRLSYGLTAIVLLATALAVVKVRNELRMTTAYDRQASALERIANALEGARQ